ncbi:angiotensin-converting enzyme [Nephila pilipes]|uniref:Angiotensin-converting enzyme n=1 Tax=Nephila pilipes TaxID=299642 RepID=A0A8X6QMF9_NEPPI|nr:angiotensin-converting enzyme [Nephila pilipes]
MCCFVELSSLQTVFHEMGHIQYYMHYANLPYLFRGAANPGFHEAIGDLILLSSNTLEYLRSVGLLRKRDLNNTKEYEKSKINYLIRMALDHVIAPMYAYIVDHWRHQVYNGKIKHEELNKKYWEYRLRYQGVCPPVKRTEKNFDIGAKYHIAAGAEYFRYFFSNILQFQLHEILCEKIHHKGPLHECNIYKKKKAGQLLAKLLEKGKSKPWKEILREFSHQKVTELDASSILKYFKPLMKWLKQNNRDEYKGWNSKDPNSCPGSNESRSDTTVIRTEGFITSPNTITTLSGEINI